ncbi:hypothetical protein LTR97_001181 [Elasticomyces elasticus]|uniref:Ankyrin repeat protein n=1 Tax=Elasticomyces elasticus TaxID=574655 RepID=A0AAN8A5Q9_9PEZI|nr:hypothetical protein LTR97_001181 [Elasticomyces elasticus]
MPRERVRPRKLTPEQLGTNLLLGAKQGDLKGVREALIQGAGIDWYERDLRSAQTGSMPKTALVIAIVNSHDKVVQFLISHGANTVKHSMVRCTDSALHLAAKLGRESTVSAVLKGYRAAGPLATWGWTDWASYSARDCLDLTSMTPFAHAVERNHHGLFKLLAPTRMKWDSELPPSPENSDRFYADVAKRAVGESNPRKFLGLWLGDMLPRDREPSSGQRPTNLLRLIDVCRYTSTMKLLLWVYRMNDWPVSLLRETDILNNAVESHDSDNEFVAVLCRLVDINRKGKNGSTALQLACGLGKVDIVKALLDNGAWPDCVDDEGSTPLHDICGSIHPRDRVMARMLLEAGANVNSRDMNGDTPLFHAAVNRIRSGEKCNAAMMLIASGATALSHQQRQRLRSIVFHTEFGIQPRKLMPRDLHMRLEYHRITRRRSMNDMTKGARVIHGYAQGRNRETASSSPGLAREQNWIFRVWGRFWRSRNYRRMSWGFTSEFPWKSDDPDIGSRWLYLEINEAPLPTLTGPYAGGVDCTPTPKQRYCLRLYVLRHLEKQLQNDDLSHLLVAASRSVIALDLAYKTSGNLAPGTVDPRMTRNLHALCLVRQPCPQMIITARVKWE